MRSNKYEAEKSSLEIIEVNERFAIRNKNTKNFIIPFGFETREQAEEKLRELNKNND